MTSSPLTFDEVREQLEVRGSRLPEDHYHQMLKNFPSFPPLMLHEVRIRSSISGIWWRSLIIWAKSSLMLS